MVLPQRGAWSDESRLVQRQRVAHLALTLTRRYCLSFPSRSAVGPLTTLRRHYCLGISISGRRCGPAPKPSKPKLVYFLRIGALLQRHLQA